MCDDRIAGINFLKDRRVHERQDERWGREKHGARDLVVSSFLSPCLSPLSPLELPSSFRHTSAPPLFQPLHPRFFIRLFARAFRHLTPVVSRHRRSCPTITKDFVRRYWRYARETSGPSLYLWYVPISFSCRLLPAWDLISRKFRDATTMGLIRWRRHGLD